ncbi:MAG: VanZ family protein [Candidatus Omnitrophica bacterium]|nr:VanZ family protein [Candidatus Omnitrophota bacterium]
MLRKTKIILDWTVLTAAFGFTLILIPLYYHFLISMGQAKVDIFFDRAADILIGAIFLFLLAYLVKRDKESPSSAYLWLVGIVVAGLVVSMGFKITHERLHFLTYCLLSMLVWRALRHHIGTKELYLASFLLVMTFSVADELFQLSGLGGRNFEWKDLAIDWLSAAAGIALVVFVVRPKLEASSLGIQRGIKRLREGESYLKKRGKS